MTTAQAIIRAFVVHYGPADCRTITGPGPDKVTVERGDGCAVLSCNLYGDILQGHKVIAEAAGPHDPRDTYHRPASWRIVALPECMR